MRYPGNIIIKIILILLLISSLAFSIFWLWQRQPTGQIEKEPDNKTGSEQADLNQPIKEDIEITSPQDHAVQTTDKFLLSGKTDPNSYVVIYSNTANHVTLADENGNFKNEIEIASKLNLINIEVLSEKLEPKFKKTLTYYLDKTQQNQEVYTGEVKNIFDTVITITSDEQEIAIRTNKSTAIELPKTEDIPEEKGIKGIRIADFVIALGTKNKDVVAANTVQVTRGEKSQNNREFQILKLITNAKFNIFSAKNQNGQILEFTTTPASQIQEGSQEAKQADIQKEKNAIIIFHTQNDQKIADLVYLLPG